MSRPTNECQRRLGQFLRKELAGWMGLPVGCTAQAVAGWLPIRPGEGTANLGGDLVAYRFRALEAAGFTEPVRLYFHEGNLALVRSGLWSADRDECARLVKDQGEPPDRLSLVFGMGTIADGEWVYAARGLTLAVIPATGLIAGVYVYPPCDFDTYRRRLHHNQPARELPKRGA